MDNAGPVDGEDDARRRRPGGRSAKVRAAVLQATLDEIAANGLSALAVGDIAARAKVHPTSIYRRWKTLERLVLDAALSAAAAGVPMPNTGSLRGDLTLLLKALDSHLRSPLGRGLLALSAANDPAVAAARDAFWRQRLDQAKELFERAKARREIAPATDPVMAVEFAIAPLYLHAVVLQQGPPSPAALARHVTCVLRAFAGK
jgi:AcrR family transcriptional regulator